MKGDFSSKNCHTICGSSAPTIEEDKAIYGRLELHRPVLPSENHNIF
jgi:hypothetical protein